MQKFPSSRFDSRSSAPPDPVLAVDGQKDAALTHKSILIHTKTQVPSDCGDTLHRERLESLVTEVLRRRLTMLVAPPGCGKTTLAWQWAEQLRKQGTQIAWFSVDADDNDPLQFLLYLDQAITISGLPPSDVDSLVARAKKTRHYPDHALFEISSVLINRVAEARNGMVIILDNYSWITETKIHGQLSYILSNSPSNLHLVVLVSAPPPLPLGQLRARNQLLELSSVEISFTKPETLELLCGDGSPIVQPEQLREIYRQTQGWPAAVRIISQSINKSETSSPSRQGIMDCRTFDAIDEYLDDLFVGYPADLIDMMVDMSIVDAVSLSLCQMLTEHKDIETFFCQLRQQQILMPSDQDRGLFAYPAPVKRYLNKKLARKGQHHLSMLRRRAYEWYSNNQLWDLAIDHALASGDIEIALRWLEGHAMSLIKAGYLGKFEKWHRHLTSLSISLPQKALLAFAWAYAISRSLSPALELVAAIDANFDETQPSTIHAECDAIRAVAYASADNIEQASEWLAKCARHDFPDTWIGNLIASIELYCRFQSGQWAEFFSEPTALNAQGEGETNTHVLRLSILGWAMLVRGKPKQAEQYVNEALRLTPTVRKKDVLRFAALPASVLAAIYYEADRLDELSALLDDWMGDILSSGYLDSIMITFLAAARNAAKQGEFAKALNILDRAEVVAMQHKWLRLEAAVVLERLRLFLNEGRQVEAEGCFQRLSQMPRGSEGGYASTICTVKQTVTIAKASLALYSDRAIDAIAPLKELLAEFSLNDNELFAVRISTLLSIAYLKENASELAELSFRETLERAEKGGFVSAVIDQGPEVGRLLTDFSAQLENSKGTQRLRKYAERLLRNWKCAFEAAMGGFDARGNDEGAGYHLSPKEHEVLRLMAMGKSNKEIARSLSVTPETIKTHIKRMFAKLSVDRRTQAVDKAHALGMLTTSTMSSLR